MNCHNCKDAESDGRKFYNIGSISDNPFLREVADRKKGLHIICSDCILELLDKDPSLKESYNKSKIRHDIHAAKRPWEIRKVKKIFKTKEARI